MKTLKLAIVTVAILALLIPSVSRADCTNLPTPTGSIIDCASDTFTLHQVITRTPLTITSVSTKTWLVGVGAPITSTDSYTCTIDPILKLVKCL
jgi:hypothetical protein